MSSDVPGDTHEKKNAHPETLAAYNSICLGGVGLEGGGKVMED